MWYPAELVVRNYIPNQLEKGMLFLNIIHPGTHKETFEVFSLDRIPRDEERFVSINGYPIEFYIINAEDVLAEPKEIAWFDLGEDFDVLTEISLKEINIILNEYDGFLEIDIDEEAYDEEELIIPVIQDDKVSIRFYTEDEEEEENNDDD